MTTREEALREAQKGLGSFLWLGNNLHNYDTPRFREMFVAALADARKGYDAAEAALATLDAPADGLLSRAAEFLALRPYGHVGTQAIPWFTHGGVSHDKTRPDCVVCQWLAEYAALAAGGEYDTITDANGDELERGQPDYPGQ